MLEFRTWGLEVKLELGLRFKMSLGEFGLGIRKC